MELSKTLKDATDIGASHYFTGKPCHAGHLSKRNVKGRACVECRHIRQKKWRLENPDKNKVLVDRNNHTDKRKATKRTWKEANREKLRQQDKEWYYKNPEKAAAKAKRWKSKNVEVCRIYSRNRKALLKGASGKHTKQDVLELYKQQNGKCVCCKKCLANGYHVDHKIALTKGGSNDASNLQLLCQFCNMSKSDKDYDLWLKETYDRNAAC